MRTKLTVKNPRPASPTRAPVRSGSLVARKPVRPAAPAAADKPARPKPAAAPKAAGEHASRPRGTAGETRPGADRATAKRAPRDGGAGRAGEGRPSRSADGKPAPRGEARSYRGADAKPAGERTFGRGKPDAEGAKRPAYRDTAGGEGAKRSFGERRTSSDRPARRSDDDARPRRAGAGAEGGKRPSYRDTAGGEGAKRSFGERRTPSDRPARRSDDDARPRRASAGAEGGKRAPYRDSAGSEGGKRPSYRDTAGSEGTKRSFGERRTPSDRPARRSDDEARPRRASAGTEGGKRPAYRDTAGGEGTKRSFGERPARPARDGAERRPGAGIKTAQPVKRRTADVDHGDETGLMRLSKRMSELGLCSRREADEWIEKGWVLVDGERIDTLGTKVRADQRIEIDERAQAAQAAQVTILLHKPVGYVSGQAEDGYEPAAVLITRDNHWSGDRSPLRFSPQHLRTLAPAGRLDIDSTGLLVLTQNGRIAKQLIGEQSDVDKEYLVRVKFGERLTDIDQHFPAESLAKLRHGLELDGVALKPAMVSWQNGEQLRFVLREGRKRQIRRMCELVGLEVIGLKRVRMGRVMLGALPQGQWRYLSADESF
ncbi:pseudouridine synthase [Burkholderia pseudomultivorans]|uniref:pseudouridine synthase n=1 Tax=Burkholderia pseudomultivorans TaxID=1207504 RepID=UPI0009BCD402|nr:pseudouridine synthase [Burkholderia pseudomultivorans]